MAWRLRRRLPAGMRPEETVTRQELQTLVEECLRILPATRREVIVARFGLDGKPPRTFDQIGAKLKISRERVRQLETSALRRMQKLFKLSARMRELRDDVVEILPGGGRPLCCDRRRIVEFNDSADDVYDHW